MSASTDNGDLWIITVWCFVVNPLIVTYIIFSLMNKRRAQVYANDVQVVEQEEGCLRCQHWLRRRQMQIDRFGQLPNEVASRILQYVNNTDILNCALVRQSWYTRTRWHQRDRAETYYYIRNISQDFLSFNNALNFVDLSMINGIWIWAESSTWQVNDVVFACENALNHQFKYFYINHTLINRRPRDPDVRLIQEILRINSQSIKKLCLRMPGTDNTTLFTVLTTLLGHYQHYNRLREFHGLHGAWPSNSLVCEFLTNKCPRLQCVLGQIQLNPDTYTSDAFLRAARDLRVTITNARPAEWNFDVAKLCNEIRTLYKLYFPCYSILGTLGNYTIWYRQLTLQHSRNLRVLHICPCHLHWIIQTFEPNDFPELHDIHLYEHSRTRPLNVNVKFDVYRWLEDLSCAPKLRTISIMMKAFVSVPLPYLIVNGVAIEPFNNGDRCISLRVRDFDDRSNYVRDFSRLNRSIIDLDLSVISVGVDRRYHTSSIFSYITSLTTMTLYCTDSTDHAWVVDNIVYHSNFDTLLCGLDQEEFRFLFNESRANRLDLTNFQYVPMRPALTYLTGLRSLCLMDTTMDNHRRRPITEVTGHLIFQRMPNLNVELKTRMLHRNDYRRLSQFVRITYDR